MQGCALVWMHATFCATSVVGSMVEVRMKGGTVYHLATHSSSFGFHDNSGGFDNTGKHTELASKDIPKNTEPGSTTQ